MQLRQLEYVHNIVLHKTMREAAKKLYVTEPTISQQISKLENEIGFPLFQKNGRSVELTSQGKKIYPAILEVLESVENLKRSIAYIKQPDCGTINFGLGPIYIKSTLSDLVDYLNKLYPKVSLNIYGSGSMELLDSVEKGNLDVAVIYTSKNTRAYMESKQINCLTLSDVKFVLMTPEHHPFINKKIVSLKDLQNQPLILFRNGLIRETVIQHLGTKYEGNIICSFGDYLSILKLVQDGIGISIVPISYVDSWSTEQRSGVAFLDIKDFENTTKISLIYKKKKFYPDFFKKFIEIIMNKEFFRI